MATESVGDTSLIKGVFLRNYKDMVHHYVKDDRAGSIFRNVRRRGKLDAERRSLEKVLYASSLDAFGIPKDSSPLMIESCHAIAETLVAESPEALRKWLEDFRVPHAYSTDHTDKRVRMIVELAENILQPQR